MARQTGHSFVTIMLLLLAFLIGAAVYQYNKPPQQSMVPDGDWSKQDFSAVDLKSWVRQNQSRNTPRTTESRPTNSTLDLTLAISSSVYQNRSPDVNGDGLMNCIDCAVVFYRAWPDKSTVRIIHNRPLNHLFNSVYINGRWITVEPQRRDGSMAGWTNYDPRWDVNETDKWKVYAQ